MASDDQVKQVADRVTATLKEICDTNMDEVAREGYLGKDLSFAPAVPYVRRLIDLFKPFQGKDLSQIGYSNLAQIQSQAEGVANTLRQIKQFSPNRSGNVGGERLQLINQIRDVYDGLFASVAPISAFLSSSDQTLDALRSQTQQQAAALTEMRNVAESQLTQMGEILKAARDASAKVGVSAHASSFRDQADSHRRSARLWLEVGAVFAVAAALWAWFGFSHIPEPTNGTSAAFQYLHFGIPRVIVLSLLFYAVFWSAKNYVSHTHNEVVNRHRQNALKTFETFVQSTADAATKDAVLVRTTEAVFMPQPTGYLPSEVEPPIPSAMIQILREAADRK